MIVYVQKEDLERLNAAAGMITSDEDTMDMSQYVDESAVTNPFSEFLKVWFIFTLPYLLAFLIPLTHVSLV